MSRNDKIKNAKSNAAFIGFDKRIWLLAAELNFKIWLVYPIFAPFASYLSQDEILAYKSVFKTYMFSAR